MSKLRWAAVLAIFLFAVPAVALSDEPAGHILWLTGQVERVGADGSVLRLAKDDAVYEGDLIRSAPGSSAQLIMRDEALIALRAESSVKLSKYRYGGHEDGAERAIVELIKGGLRSITGVIGRVNKENYRLKSDGHVIGIRGTDHETFLTDAGTYNRVTLGGTYLEGPGGRIDLAPGEVGFASMLPGSAPVRLERTPEFMQLAMLSSGDAGPRPRSASAGDELRLQNAMGSAGPVLSGAAAPVSPSQASGESSPQRGFGTGGRCGGACADPLKNNGKKTK
jgi:hypothetical protein